jgi:tRNA threonylcarbamoyl adenosine modification protein YeaZ
VEGGRVIAEKHYEEANRHAERLLPLVMQLLAEAAWPKSSIDRIGVGVGPGSFTGLRVGIGLANGMALGLRRPLVGVGSLRAMAHAGPAAAGARVAVLDAKRSEFFVAAYSESGDELLAPMAIPQAEFSSELARLLPDKDFVMVGRAAPADPRLQRDVASDLPTATSTACLAELLDPADAPALPIYVRGANAALPSLPPSPFASGSTKMTGDGGR